MRLLGKVCASFDPLKWVYIMCNCEVCNSASKFTMEDTRVTLQRDGRRQELHPNQVTVDNIRRLFQVNPAEAWLRDDIDDTAYFPQPNGSFNVTSFATLNVEGPAQSGPLPRSSLPRLSSAVTVSSTPPASPLPTPLFRSVTAPRRTPSFNLKILKAKLTKTSKHKPDFELFSQTYIELVDSTANLEYIKGVVQRRWGTGYTLVTSDGIELEDSPATQGLGFWICPRRKYYAVLRKDLSSDPSSNNVIISDSEDDFEPRKKRARKDDKPLQIIQQDISEIKEQITDFMSLSTDLKIPLALRRIVRDTFKCRICHRVPIKPPLIITKCCKTILGCEVCVNSWFSGTDALTKNCPTCRTDRGYNETMLLRGLDDFLAQIRSVIQTEEERDEEELPSINLDFD